MAIAAVKCGQLNVDNWMEFPSTAFGPQAEPVTSTSGRRRVIRATVPLVLCLLVAGQGAAAAADQWDGACAQPGLQQPIAAPTVPAWHGVRLGIDHVAGIRQG